MRAAVDEVGLIQLAQRGDVDAFNRLVLSHQHLAYNVAYRMLGHAEAAADVTQEAFLSAYQSIRQLRGSSFKPWLLRIVANGCYDLLRARQRRPTTSLDALEDDEDNPLEIPDSAESPEDTTLRHELRRQLEQELLALPPDQRLAVVLYDVNGLTYEEIAEATRASLGTVKSRLSRGRAKLRASLAARGELPTAPRRHEGR